MAENVILVTDTIGGQISTGYHDLWGVSNRLADLNAYRFRMIVFSKEPVQLRIPRIRPESPAFHNLLHPDLVHPHPALVAQALMKKIDEINPRFICLPHTMRFCQAAADLSVRLETAVITGVDAIIRTEDRIVLRRHMMNGKYTADMVPISYPCIFTVNPGTFESTDKEYVDVDHARIIRENITGSTNSYKSLEISSQASDNSPVEDADVVVSAGRGIGDSENLALIQAVSDLFKNGAVGASRPVCDTGRLPYSRQVGETGKQISPKLYLACGISGASQHLLGIRQARTVIAINSDPRAAIFRRADYGVVERLEEFLPVLLDRFEHFRKETP